jgi:hypothetical protein
VALAFGYHFPRDLACLALCLAWSLSLRPLVNISGSVLSVTNSYLLDALLLLPSESDWLSWCGLSEISQQGHCRSQAACVLTLGCVGR